MCHDDVDARKVWDGMLCDGCDTFRYLGGPVETVLVGFVGKSPVAEFRCVRGSVEPEFGATVEGEAVSPFDYICDSSFRCQLPCPDLHCVGMFIWVIVLVQVSLPVFAIEG